MYTIQEINLKNSKVRYMIRAGSTFTVPVDGKMYKTKQQAELVVKELEGKQYGMESNY